MVGGEVASYGVGEGLVAGDDLQQQIECGSARSCVFKIFGDGVEKYSRSVTSSEPFRVPGGYRARHWEVQVSGNVDIDEIAFAPTLSDLS
jgi:hypothetical protein